MHTVVHWLERTRDWMDDRGRPAWIIATVVGFILFWPVGLAILVFLDLEQTHELQRLGPTRPPPSFPRHRAAPATAPSTPIARRR